MIMQSWVKLTFTIRVYYSLVPGLGVNNLYVLVMFCVIQMVDCKFMMFSVMEHFSDLFFFWCFGFQFIV